MLYHSESQQKEEEFLRAFGMHLKMLRMDRSITQRQLAYALDIEISQISRIERGVINTSLLNIVRIAKILKVPVAELFNFEF